MSQTKALLIKSSTSENREVKGKWHLFEEAQPYIQGIETGEIAKEVTPEVLNMMISGVPTPWARARLFQYAFPYTQVEANISTSGLIEFYKILTDEWKGLIAAMAIFPDRFKVSDPIRMDRRQTDNLYFIPNAFGRMLFEDYDLWCDPNELKNDPDANPFIQLIYYAGKLVGATSPFSVVFTAIDYSGLPQAGDMPWYRDGRFDDPLKYGNLTNDQIQKTYLLVSNIIDRKFADYDQVVNSNRGNKKPIDFDALKDFLRQWKQELRQTGNDIVDEGTLDGDFKFVNPYAPLFDVKQNLYFFPNGRISFSVNPEDTDFTEVDPKEILLQEDYVMVLNEDDEEQPLEKSAIFTLAVHDPEGKPEDRLYFPIPLSKKGIGLFRNTIGDLVKGQSADFHSLNGYIKPDEYKLVVELHLVIDSKRITPIVKEYKLEPIENGRSIIMWPNFISDHWTHYYLYTEFPVKDRSTQVIPFFKDPNEKKFITDDKGGLIYSTDTDKHLSAGLQVTNLVEYPPEKVDASSHKYDILKSNKPIAGMEIRKHLAGKQRICGYLIIKNPDDDTMGDRRLKDYTHQTTLQEAVVGIDFGSNNSCISYSRVNTSEVQPIPFNNRRVFLVGAEVRDPNQSKIAVPNELYFFQNESPDNGQIKSWVHEHNSHYIREGMGDEEVSGGVPTFEPNIHIKDMNDKHITTNAGILHHSMKWLNDPIGEAKKKAYLKTVWLKVCADLYANGFKPAELRWSYPGSFSNWEMLQYKTVYNEVGLTMPIKNVNTRVLDPSTEAEAVSNYALSTNMSLQSTNIFLGIDVGGSTSDVLVIAMDRANGKYKLLKQSSLRLAAGYLMSAIKTSPAFRQTIIDFHNNPNSSITIPNINTLFEKPETSPFFLNAVFDRLKDHEFDRFYNFIAQKSRHLFALPAYICGLLMYYSGQLVKKTIEENGDLLSEVKAVDLFPFGKGGRIFDWLASYPGGRMSLEYYNRCFKAGFGENNENIQVRKNEGIRKDNKSEVSKGLSAPQRVESALDIRENSDIFGEAGYVFVDRSNGNAEVNIGARDTVNYAHFENLDFDLKIPEKFEEFNKFLDIFLDFIGPAQTGIIPNTTDLHAKRDVIYNELKSFIINDSEYTKALKQPPFDYKHSMLVLEGMCYLKTALIPEIYRN